MAVLMLGGCALVEDKVPIDYVPPANLSVAPGASDVTVIVTGQDRRSANWDRIGNKKNGYGVEMAAIKAENDVVELTRHAVEHELESLGFKIGSDGLKVNVELQNFYNDFKVGFFAGDSVGEVTFSLTVTRSDGSTVYVQQYRGRGINKNIQLASGTNAKEALQMALTDAMQTMIADTALQKAMVDAVKAPKMTTASSRIPGS
jgi:uncharacterized lipoprotein